VPAGRRRHRGCGRVGLVLLALLAGGGGAAAAPFLPKDDAMVLERGLPSSDPRMRQIRALEGQLAARPGDLPLAMEIAEKQLEMGVEDADPRLVGNAQATLTRWWTDKTPVGLVVLRARVDQAKHDFANSRKELHAALAIDPNNRQALVVLSGVDEVTGELDEADRACKRVAALRRGIVGAACLASAESLLGHARSSAQALAAALRNDPPAFGGLRLWAQLILAQIETQLGDPAAERHFKEALVWDRYNPYLLTVYADWLLDHGRPAEVPKLLKDTKPIDALYVRLAQAAQALHDPKLATYRAELAARFAEARRQGDTLHLRDASRFTLAIEHDAPRALGYALQNWTIQRAPIDARTVLEAALAADEPQAARPVAQWIARTHLEDVTLARLLRQLRLAVE
jgi:Tfp pilus assembly protein PilF